MNIADRAPAHIRAIAPYQPGKPIAELARELGLDETGIVKLASNENPLGPNPRVIAAIEAAMAELTRYPDGNGYQLKQAIARRHGVAMSQIVLGNGSNDVLELAARALLVPGTSAIYSQHAFAVYPLATQATGATRIEVPARAWGHDLAAMRAALRADTRIVYIANPNNPTGTFVTGDELRAFIAAVPRDVLVVLDEAYTEYLPEALRYDSPRWLAEFPHLAIVRTLSKAYGLAGLRVGFALAAPEVAELMNRVRQPFNVNSLALAAAAVAIEDEDFVRESAALNERGLRQLVRGLEALGIEFIASVANFVSFRAGDAAALDRGLLERGVIVRPIAGYGMPQWLRVSVGTEVENARFLDALAACLGRPAPRG
jgi:histidinol-phosphate aminotransferase